MSRHKIILLILFIFLTGVAFYLLFPIKGIQVPPSTTAKAEKFKRDFLASQTPADTSAPNIIVILADDLGKYDLTLYGQGQVNAPNINQLASEGVKFNNAYVSAPVCSPSRAGLMTGRYQERFGYEFQIQGQYVSNRLQYLAFAHFLNLGQMKANDIPEDELPGKSSMANIGLPASEIMLSELLKAKGYSTALIGKWHLGYEKPLLPLQRGFGHHYGFYEAYSLYGHPDDSSLVNYHHDEFSDKHIWKTGRQGPAQIRNDEVIVDDKEYLTDKLTAEAIGFIDKNKNKPFFLYLAYNAPHSPFQAKKSDYDYYKDVKDPNKRTYYAMIKALDDGIGRLNQALKDQKLDKNTIIFFLSDNGGATYTNATDNAPLKAGKFAHFEGGINVPMLLKWPKKIHSNTTFDNRVSSLDIFSTVSAATKAQLPTDRVYDGVDLIPYLNNTIKTIPHKNLFWRVGRNSAVISENWKLIISKMDNKEYLYNLKDDPYEQKNLVQKDPKKVTELKTELSNWEKQLSAPRWKGLIHFQYNFKDGLYNVDI
ncbi:sulfatase-like hydrolase/transferase [Solitalea sp. MAHUQ-68]|uniref:Sulfatase-like hydrolase/transferase n=1 Tax=Solitalea agri TaxID=2953739 RepID=A0A9X2JBJ6_9SPHI|nr:sulfatase-like hydrolase/transferase [Solitalea agri]MCO4292552.1 sulfatase-like hydrolase/transferase [Solitalea agri]